MSSNSFTKENLDTYLRKLAKEFDINHILKMIKKNKDGNTL